MDARILLDSGSIKGFWQDLWPGQEGTTGYTFVRICACYERCNQREFTTALLAKYYLPIFRVITCVNVA